MKLTQLQEASYAGKRTLEQMMQFFYKDDELSGDDDSLFFTRNDYLARNDAAHGECNEVFWIKFTSNRKSVGVMYVDEHFDWITEQQFVTDFIIYKQQKVF